MCSLFIGHFRCLFFSSRSSFTCILYIHSNDDDHDDDDGDDLVSDAMNEVQCCSSGSTEKSVRAFVGYFYAFLTCEEVKKKLNKKNSDAIFFLYLFSTCFISFTNHI